jgi:DNA-binding FadR family transcriptional regulator
MTLSGTDDPTLRLGTRRAPAARLGVGVVHDLVTAIVTGVVAPGDLLPTETELCEHFGVSRTVIRESVKRLEEKGMVSVVQGRGTQVTDPVEWNLLDRVVLSVMIEHDDELGILDELAVVRGQLESAMAATAAEARVDADIEELRTAHDVLVASTGRLEAFARNDIDFHAVIMRISRNTLASGIARTLVRRASEYSRFYGAPGPDAHRLTIEEHARVLDAIEAGDDELAARAMLEHISAAWARRRLPRT